MGMMEVFKKLLGQSNEAEVKRLQKIAGQVLALEDTYKALDDDALRATTAKLKARLANGETLDDILPDAFAAFREAVWRVDGKRLFPVQIMHIFATDADVIREGAAYLEWLSVSFVFYSFSNCYIMCLRAVEQVKVSIAVYSSSFFVNVFFNYCFIFGKLGAPELGVRGAALGTIMARLFECAAVLVYMYRIERTVCFTPKWLLRFRSGLFSDYVRNSVPVVSNELLWALGVAVTNLTIGHMGPSFTSAVSIVNVVNNLVSVFIFGMANATAVVVGKTIGEGRLADARRAANSTVVVSVVLSLVGTALLLAGQRPIMSLYNVSQQAHDTALILMTILAAIQPFQAVGTVMVVGVLRGGDVRTNLILDSGLLWVLAIPLGLLGGFVFHWSAPVVFFCLRCDNIVKSILGFIRLCSGRWVRVVTRADAVQEA